MSISDYTQLFEKYGREYNVDPDLLASVAWQESRGNPKAVSPQGAGGLMQIMPRTAQNLGVDPSDPEQAVKGAAMLLSRSLDQHGDVQTALHEYHGGPNRKLWGPKNRDYVGKVMARYGGSASQDTVGGGAGKDDIEAALWGDDPKSKPPTPSTLEPASAPGGSPKDGAQPSGSPLEPNGAPDDGVEAALWGDTPASPTGAGKPKSGPAVYGGLQSVPIGATGEHTNEPQTKFYWQQVKGHALDPDQPEGSERHPVWMHAGQPEDTLDKLKPGTFYVTLDGHLRQVPNGSRTDMVKGFGQGIGDVVLSGADLMPGAQDSELANDLRARQATYDAAHKGDTASGAARFVGQMVGTAPAMVGAEAAAAPVLANMGPVGAFLAGKAVTKGSSLTSKLVRGASSAARNAQEGAGAAVATSSANDQPVGDQAKVGALVGAAVGPAGRAAARIGSKLFGPAGEAVARGSAAARAAEEAQSLPVPVTLLPGQAAADPAMRRAEQRLAAGNEGQDAQHIMAGAEANQQAALHANAEQIGDTIAGAPGSQHTDVGAKVSAKLNAAYDASIKGVNDAYKAARAEKSAAMLKDGKDAREAMLGAVEVGADAVPIVAKKIEHLGENGAPMVSDVYQLRKELTAMRQGHGDEAVAAGQAVHALDRYMEDAIAKGEVLGDPKVVDLWKSAIAKRAEHGRMFEGDDLIETLTERTKRGGKGNQLAVSPEDAANKIFSAAQMGWLDKANMTRDLTAVRDRLGPASDEWNAIRAEVFNRLAREGRGATSGGGEAKFSGQKFREAWEKAKLKSASKEGGGLIGILFTKDEQDLIDKFARTAQRATGTIPNGYNASGSAIDLRDLLTENAGKAGGAVAGTVLGFLGHAIGSLAGPTAGAEAAAFGAGVGGLLGSQVAEASARKAAVRKATVAAQGVRVVEPKVPTMTSKLVSRAATPVAVNAVNGVRSKLLAKKPAERPALR